MTDVADLAPSPDHQVSASHPASHRTGGARSEVRRTTVILGAFAVGLVMVFGAAFGLGRAVGPVGDRSGGQPSDQQHHPDSSTPSRRDLDHGDGS